MTDTLHDDAPFWLESIHHQGTAAFNPDKSYQVFRNVKDFGAIGDGVTDDTLAINLAISSGNRCGEESCGSSTITPALVYFPRGTYLISAPIIAYYYTQLIGDARAPPTLLAALTFEGIAVIDANPYIPGGYGRQWYVNTNNFFRSVRNFVIDLRRVPPARSQGTGIHWQVAQATSLMNIVVEMSTASGTAHQGIWMENGSGGFMGDLVFNGGKFGMWVGNQQFTARNITINNADTAIFNVWNWGWTYQGVTINNCNVGFDVLTGGTSPDQQGVGALAIIDATVNDTPIFVRFSKSSNRTLTGSLVLNNAKLCRVATAVGIVGGETVLAGGTKTIESWVQGNVYRGVESAGQYIKEFIPAPKKSSILLDSSGKIFGKTHPQYEKHPVGDFVSVKQCGAKGDGKTDDTRALQTVFDQYARSKIVFFDAGTYVVTSTLTFPAGSRIVGEAWSVIAGSGSKFQDVNNPQVVVRVGEENSVGVIEITDIIFSTVGPAAGAIVVEWNIREPAGQQGAAGMWDSHIRLGGAAGSNLELGQCPPGRTDTAPCMAAFLALHLTPKSSAYLEGTWVWLADHDLDGDGVSQISIYSGRGILSQSEGPVWMIGTASEHHAMYQYRLVGADNHYMGLIQTETPYFQPSPPAPEPFKFDSRFGDPQFPLSLNVKSSWALSVESSKRILIFGAGLYSFFNNYSQACIAGRNCQDKVFDVDSDSEVDMFSLSTVASEFQVSVDGYGVVRERENLNGFASSVTVWST